MTLLGWTCLLYLWFYSSGRSVPLQHAPTPSNKERINISLSWWTGRRTYCGAPSWRGEHQTHTQKFLNSDINFRILFSPESLSELWLFFWKKKNLKKNERTRFFTWATVWWSHALCLRSIGLNDGTFLPLQDLWLPRPLHRHFQHGPRGPTETPGPLLERPRHPAPVCTTERLLCLWIDDT